MWLSLRILIYSDSSFLSSIQTSILFYAFSHFVLWNVICSTYLKVTALNCFYNKRMHFSQGGNLNITAAVFREYQRCNETLKTKDFSIDQDLPVILTTHPSKQFAYKSALPLPRDDLTGHCYWPYNQWNENLSHLSPEPLQHDVFEFK